MNIQRFASMIENQFSAHIETFRTDNGPDFILEEFYASKGIMHQRSCVETP